MLSNSSSRWYKKCSKHCLLHFSDTSLQSNLNPLFTLAIEEVGTVNISSTAIKTVRLILTNFEGIELQDLVKLISRLLEDMDRFNFLVVSEVYQLLSTLHTKYPNMINQLPENLINNSIDVEKWHLKLTDDNIDHLSMQIHRMQWLFIYAEQKLNLLPQLDSLMQNKNVHHILANGLRKSTEGLKSCGSFYWFYFHIKNDNSFLRHMCCDNEVSTIRPFSIEGCV